MSARTRQFRIGLFVLTSLAILAAGLFAFGLRRELEPKRRFETYVPTDAGGLAVGAAVKLKGVSVGEVTRISFSWIEYPGGRPPCVVIYFEAKESVNPSPGTTAALDDEVEPLLDCLPARTVFRCDPYHGLTRQVTDRLIQHFSPQSE